MNKLLCSKKIISIVLAICLISLIILLGCSPAQTTQTTSPAAQPTTAAGPKYGGILKLSSPMEAAVMGFPPTMIGFQEFGMGRPALESLARWDAKGNPVPLLAESWSTDASAKTVTIKLKKGIKFHDNTAFDAAAVKWNLDTFLAIRPDLPKTMKVEVVDDYTIKLNLVEWDSTVLNTVLAGAMAGAIISPTAWKNAPGATTDKERNTWSGNNPVGTGPFKFVSWQKTAKQVYKKSDSYWQKGKPYLDGVEWTIIVDPMTSAASFKAKEMDGLLWVQANVARELKAGGYTISFLESGTQIKAISTNSVNPNSPFTNVKLRQALSYAIDRKAIAESIFFGFAAPVQQLSLLGMDMINPNYAGYPFDPEKAKKLVAEAGFANGVKAKIVSNPNPDDVAICTAIQGMLSKIGVTMEIETSETARHIQLTNVGPYDSMILCYLRANLEQPMPFMRSVGPNAVQHAKSVIQPEEVAKLEAIAKSATDRDVKKKAVWELQEKVFGEYCIFNPVVITFPLAAVHPYVKDAGIMKTYVDEWTPENAWLDK